MEVSLERLVQPSSVSARRVRWVAFFRFREFLFFLGGAGGEVDLAAEDGFYAGLFAFLVEVDGSEEVAVIGHGNGGHG